MSNGEAEDGVDRTLITEMLRLSPEERLRMNDEIVAGILELREAFEQAHGDQ